MSTANPPAMPKDSAGKGKKREKKSQASTTALERFKVVVRRLPPDLPEEIFWQSVAPWVDENKASWKIFYPGKARKRMSNKENVPSRAYIVFKDQEDLSIFGREYDGHVFQDKSGNVAIAVVEFAPYQKIPPEKKKVDQRMNTIEDDPDYVSFLASLQANSVKRTEADTLEAFLAAQTAADTAPTTTPLLEALKAEKAAQKEKAAIIRNHAHYKDMGSVTTIISGKGRSAQSQTQVESSKDGKKDKKKKDNAKKDTAPSTSTPTTPEKKKKGKGLTQAPPVPNNAPSSSRPVQPIALSPAKPTAAQGKGARKRQGLEAPAIVKAPSKDASPAPAIAIAGAPATTSGGTTKIASTVSGEASSLGSAAPASATPPARRGRAMLGLSSRQFEAALGGAGLRTRKPTESRAATSDTQAATSGNGVPTIAGGATASNIQEARIDDAPLPPTSNQNNAGRGAGPSRGKGRGGRGRGARPSG